MKEKHSKQRQPNFSWISQVYKLKIWQVFFIITLGIFFSYFGAFYMEEEYPRYSQFSKSLGDSLLIADIVGLTYEYFVRKESEGKIGEVFDQKLDEYESKIGENLRKIFLLDKDVIGWATSENVIDQIVEECVKVKLRDPEMGAEVSRRLLPEIFKHKSRAYNLKHELTLLPVSESRFARTISEEFYQILIHCSYEYTLDRSEFILSCVNQKTSWDIIMKDEKNEYVWFLPKTGQIPKLKEGFFRLLDMEVAGFLLEREETLNDNIHLIRCFNSNLVQFIGKKVTIDYIIETLIPKWGHHFFSNVSRATRGVSFVFDFARTDIQMLQVIDFFISPSKPSIRYIPKYKPQKAEVILDDWIFPKSGVVFIWYSKTENPQILD